MNVYLLLSDYLMGRHEIYPAEYTAEVKANAEKTVAVANELLTVLDQRGVELNSHPQTGTLISSGWRPPQINGQVKNAAPRSKHMTGEAIDIYDPEGEIDDYLMSEDGQRCLVSLRLFLEHPSATKSWSHWQTVAPKSGRRVFYP